MADGLDKLFDIAEEEKVNETTSTSASTEIGQETDEFTDNQNKESVTKTQETTEDTTEESDDSELIAQFKELTGYEGDVTDLSVEGIAAVVKEIKADIAKNYEAYDNDPELKALIEWKQQGNNIKDYFSIPQKFDKSLFDVENDAHVEAVFKSYYSGLKQLSEEEAQEQIDLLKASPDKQKLRFVTALDAIAKDVDSKYDNYLAELEQSKQKTIEEGKVLASVVESGDFGTIKLTKDEVKGFTSFLNDTATYESKWAALQSDPKKIAIMEFLAYNDCDLSKLRGITTINSSTNQRKVPNLIRGGESGQDKRNSSRLTEDEVLDALRGIK
jgi:hypothetical protein